MSKADEVYNNLLKKIINEGENEVNQRTGHSTRYIWCDQIEFDLRDGFPLLTSRYIPIKSIAVELAGFIKGITSKKWFQDRGCKYWDYWCNPQVLKHSTDLEVQKEMKHIDDLGMIYGKSWRAFQDPSVKGGQEVDQLMNVFKEIQKKNNNRRLIVMGWNPLTLDYTALPCCHYDFQFNISKGKYLDLCWSQRSVDTPLGLPSNIASYALLLKLMAHSTGLIPRKLTGHLKNVHIYDNQIELAKQQVELKTSDAPKVELNTEEFVNIFDWEPEQITVTGYKPQSFKYPRPAI